MNDHTPHESVHNALEQIGILHQAYCDITGMELRCEYSRMSAWQEFIRRGFTVDDIRIVVHEIRRAIPSGARNEGALKFRNLIVNIDGFEEDLASAKANMRSRRPPMTEKDKILKQTGRATETSSSAKSVATVISALTPEGQRAAAEFAKLKQTI